MSTYVSVIVKSDIPKTVVLVKVVWLAVRFVTVLALPAEVTLARAVVTRAVL